MLRSSSATKSALCVPHMPPQALRQLYCCIQRLVKAKGKVYWPHSFCLGVWCIGWNFIRCFLSPMDVPTVMGGHFCDGEKSLSHREDYHENILAPKMELLAVNNICWAPFCYRESLSSQRAEFKEHFHVHWSIIYLMTTKMQVMPHMIYGKYVCPQNSTRQKYRVQHWPNTVCAFLRKTDSSSYQKLKLFLLSSQ